MTEQKSEATRRVEIIDGILGTYPNGLEYWRLITDPEDYGRTIENIFHFAFLIKDGQAKFFTKNNVPHVSTRPGTELSSLPP